MRCLVVVDPGHSLASSTRVVKPIQGLGERGIKGKILLKTRKWQRVPGGHSGRLVSLFHEQGKLEGWVREGYQTDTRVLGPSHTPPTWN